MGDAPTLGRAEERAEAGARVDRPAPRVADADPPELGKGREQVRREPLERRGPDVSSPAEAVAVVPDGIVATEQDPVVGRQTVVVELVPRVGETFATVPGQRRALRRRERLGREDVVVDRKDVAPDPPDERRERARREHDPVRADRPTVGDEPDRVPRARAGLDARARVEDATSPLERASKDPRETGRVDESRRRTVREATEAARRVDRPVQRRAGEQLDS